MPVTVQRPDADAIDTHATGENLAIEDGHLKVTRWTSRGWKTIAVYSPGSWVHAGVDEAPRA